MPLPDCKPSYATTSVDVRPSVVWTGGSQNKYSPLRHNSCESMSMRSIYDAESALRIEVALFSNNALGKFYLASITSKWEVMPTRHCI